MLLFEKKKGLKWIRLHVKKLERVNLTQSKKKVGNNKNKNKKVNEIEKERKENHRYQKLVTWEGKKPTTIKLINL